MSRYLFINIAIIIFPFAFSFEKQITFYKKWKSVLPAIAVVGAVFIIWDIYATYRGDWGFSEAYTLPFKLFGLPIEEWLFFVTVPYSTLFLYETCKLYLPRLLPNLPNTSNILSGTLAPKDKLLPFAIAFILVLLAGLQSERYYTFTILLFTAASIALYTVKGRLFTSVPFVVAVAISYIPFFIVNYLLTSAPIVWYNPAAILGPRVTTIPVEDFLYSYAMISLWIFAYEFFENRHR